MTFPSPPRRPGARGAAAPIFAIPLLAASGCAHRPAQIRLAGELRRGARIPRSAGAKQGIARDRATAIGGALDQCQKMPGEKRSAALTTLATQLDGDAQSAADGARVRAMAAAVRDLANGVR